MSIKDWLSYWFRISRMDFRHHVKNHYYRLRYYFIRRFRKSKLKNKSPENKRGYKLTFLDNFDKVSWGTSQDDKQWNIGEHWGRFHSGKPNVYYGPPKEIKDNCAVMSVEYEPREFTVNGKREKIPFKVSCLSSHPWKQQYGRFECRMTLPVGVAVFPAFWIWGTTWPPEIDILETHGGERGQLSTLQRMSIHWGEGEDQTSIKAWRVKIDDTKNKTETGFHEFVLEWSPNKIEMFTNGVKVFEFTNKKILDDWYNIWSSESWVILNHSLQPTGTNRTKYLAEEDEKDYYSEFRVDYVRVYEKI